MARIFALLLLLLAPAPPAPAAESAPVDVYLFGRAGCPHCERALAFLQRLAAEQPAVRVHYCDVWGEAANRELFLAAGRALDADVASVPLTIVGGQWFSGFFDDASTGAAIRARVRACQLHACPDPVAALRQRDAVTALPPGVAATPIPETLFFPLLGELQLRELSLPVLTVALAALDGFNPCAMWTLVFLLGLLVGINEPRRRWLLGAAFIVASAAVYYLFLAAWLELFLWVGMLAWVRIGVGLVALAAGGYYLRQVLLRRDLVCTVTAPERRRRLFERLREQVQGRQLPIALAGIVALAVAVNLVELLCSAGIPAVYTQVLALGGLPAWQYQLYLLLYIAVFLLDDLFVFVVAMTTLQVASLDARHARIAHLLGALVLGAVGAALIWRPQWLAMGS